MPGKSGVCRVLSTEFGYPRGGCRGIPNRKRGQGDTGDLGTLMAQGASSLRSLRDDEMGRKEKDQKTGQEIRRWWKKSPRPLDRDTGQGGGG